MPAGYSGTPIAKKLGLKDGMRVWFANMPPSVLAEIKLSGLDFAILKTPKAPIDFAHIFVRKIVNMEREAGRLRPLLAQAGIIWLSWPKKASKVETELTDMVVRDFFLKGDMVDIKVCSVDETWSGLKFVIRKSARI